MDNEKAKNHKNDEKVLITQKTATTFQATL